MLQCSYFLEVFLNSVRPDLILSTSISNFVVEDCKLKCDKRGNKKAPQIKGNLLLCSSHTNKGQEDLWSEKIIAQRRGMCT